MLQFVNGVGGKICVHSFRNVTLGMDKRPGCGKKDSGQFLNGLYFNLRPVKTPLKVWSSLLKRISDRKTPGFKICFHIFGDKYLEQFFQNKSA